MNNLIKAIFMAGAFSFACARSILAYPAVLSLSVVDTATLLVTAPDGRQTGFDPVSGLKLKGSPQSAYFVQDNSIDTDAETVDATETVYSVDYSMAQYGTYNVQLIGLKSDTYQLATSAFDGINIHPSYTVMPGVASKGSRSTFRIHFSSGPAPALMVTRMATFASTLADIGNSLELGLIDNKGTADELSREIQESESAFAKNKKREALSAFKRYVTAQNGKHISGIALQVLQEDVDSLLSPDNSTLR